MERQRDRLLTMMVVPLMTCSARLPVYTLIIGALFPAERIFGLPVQGLLMVAMYLFSLLIALAAAGILGRTVLRGKNVPLVLELPPYRLPTFGSVFRMMFERARTFLTEAGSVILVCTVLMWGLLHFPETEPPDGFDDLPVAEQQAFEAQALEHSFAGRLGKGLEPALRPIGMDWKIGVGMIGAFAAREVFVSTMGLVYGVGGDVDEEAVSLRERIRADVAADGGRTSERDQVGAPVFDEAHGELAARVDEQLEDRRKPMTLEHTVETCADRAEGYLESLTEALEVG
jgi:ferrous iron transport protein B